MRRVSLAGIRIFLTSLRLKQRRVGIDALTLLTYFPSFNILSSQRVLNEVYEFRGRLPPSFKFATKSLQTQCIWWSFHLLSVLIRHFFVPHPNICFVIIILRVIVVENLFR